MRIDLADGRAVLARLRPPGSSPRLRILSIVLIVAGGVGLAAFPITRGSTRRLEGLRSGVERWGAGALSLRVDDAGDDEVAVVARTFNAAAARVEDLLPRRRRCSPTPATNCARRWPACAWRSSSGSPSRAPTSMPRSCAISPRSTNWSRRSCSPAASTMPRPTLRAAAHVDLLGLAAEEAARFERVRRRRRRAPRASRSRATRRCCAASSAISWRTPPSTDARRSQIAVASRRRRGADRRLRPTAKASRRPSASGCSSRFTAPPGAANRRRLGPRPCAGAPDRRRHGGGVVCERRPAAAAASSSILPRAADAHRARRGRPLKPSPRHPISPAENQAIRHCGS